MTEREKLAEDLNRMADIAMGTSKATRFLGKSRDQFVRTLTEAATVIRGSASAPFQSECPTCGRRITITYIDGKRRTRWE